MTGIWLPLFLQLVGVGVIIAEVILPSGGLLSALAIGIFGYSLYIVFQEMSMAVAMTFVAADIVLIPMVVIISFKMLANSPVTLKAELKSEDGVTSQAPELENLLGKEGVVLSSLRPSGSALIDGHRVDVVSRGEFIEKDSKVIVEVVTGNQVIVKEHKV
ncbi:MAG: serine protease [Desulfobulbaceae bacterium]|nr:serine protease [Desulfobulbaceae bacterium]HIJ79327.1 serine protease [Deltaproteobacteria bacterium]